MPLSAVLFDLDDTLHDKSATLRAVAARHFVESSLAERRVSQEAWTASYVALNNERIEKSEVFARLAVEYKLDAALQNRLREDFDASLGASAQPFEGARELLAYCREFGLKTGIVTNGRDFFQRSKIAGMGITEFVDVIVTSGGLGIKKPDHRIFLECLTQLAVEPNHAAFVGDDFGADMTPNIELGMRPIWKSPQSSESVAFSSDSLKSIHAYLQGAV